MHKRRLFVLVSVAAAFGAGLTAPTHASPAYDPTMLTTLAGQLGTDIATAAMRLDRETKLSSALERLRAGGAAVDGAFFDGTGALVVNTSAADEAKAHGLTPRTSARGEQALIRLSDEVLQAIGNDTAQVESVGPDVAADRVVVRVTDAASPALIAKLSGFRGVTVETGAVKPVAQADVVPGRIMDLVPGTNCSLGFNGLRGTQKVLLTAGHCVEGNPRVLDANGTQIGRGIATRFPSVDMGLMQVDAEDTQRAYVDTRRGNNVRVSGMSKAPIGSAICKAGNTTGWTCGTITHYNQTVLYGGETVRTTGLARATVCTEGGDSGGAYISGTVAQGMTSGGPSFGPDCGWNSGSAVRSYSYYQPVVDAANHYGVRLLTS